VTRRSFLGAAVAANGSSELVVPVALVVDTRAKRGEGALERFLAGVWGEAERDFGRCGIRLESRRSEGSIGLAASDRPVLKGLVAGRVNFVLTDTLPMMWDRGKGLAGVATRYDGYHVCVAALRRAHGHQFPFVSTNTCVHELLHVLLMDIFEAKPDGFYGAGREARIDFYATRMWLLGSAPEVRRSTALYLEALRKLQ
jgi:hypothetical protein